MAPATEEKEKNNNNICKSCKLHNNNNNKTPRHDSNLANNAADQPSWLCLATRQL